MAFCTVFHVVSSATWYERSNEVIGQPPLSHVVRVKVAEVELSSSSIMLWGGMIGAGLKYAELIKWLTTYFKWKILKFGNNYYNNI